MTIKTFKKIFENLLIVNGGKKVNIDLFSENNTLEPIAKYKDIVHFMVDETINDLKVNKERGAFFYTNSCHIDIYVK